MVWSRDPSAHGVQLLGVAWKTDGPFYSGAGKNGYPPGPQFLVIHLKPLSFWGQRGVCLPMNHPSSESLAI